MRYMTYIMGDLFVLGMPLQKHKLGNINQTQVSTFCSFSGGWGATNVETKSAAYKLWPRILDEHIIPSFVTSLTSTHHGKHIRQHTLCIFPHKMH